MKQIIYLLFASCACIPMAATAQQSRQQAQSEGLSLGSSMAKDPSAIVQSGVGSGNVMGDQFTGSAPSNLTNQSTGGPLFNIGNESRLQSVGTVDARGSYSNERDSQADEAVHFLNRRPVLKPQLSPDDRMLNADTYGLGQSPFASSSAQECRQVEVSLPDETEIVDCKMTYFPYVYTCGTGTTVNFTKEAYCPKGKKLDRISSYNNCPTCIDRYVVIDVFCGTTEGTYQLNIFTSTCASGDCRYATYFTGLVIEAMPGSTGERYLGSNGFGCNMDYYYSQNCNSTTCSTVFSRRNSTCGGRNFTGSGNYPIPFRDVMNETDFNNCTAAEQLGI